MRILAVTPYYAPEGGGLERYAHATLSRLASQGHTVEAVTFTRGDRSEETYEGVHVRRQPPLLRIGNTPVDPRLRSRLDERIQDLRPDVVVAHTPVPFPAEMAYLAAKKARVPFVTTYHAGRLTASAPLLRGVAALDRWTLERRMLAGSDRLIAVSPFVRDHVLHRQRERVTVIPPGVDATRFRPAQGSDGRTILFVAPLARAYRWKGVDVLWRAYQAVHAAHPDARLVLVGDGDRFREFQSKADTTTGEVVLAGRLSEAELVALYQRAAMLVLPSTNDAESFGMVLAEANACGCPVVASRVGGVPSFVRDGENGYLVPPGNVQALAKRILRLLEAPDLARVMGRRGRERVLRENDWDVLAARTEKVLHSAARVALAVA